MSITLYDIIPPGVSNEKESPFFLSRAAMPRGERTEILPWLASDYSEPTRVKDFWALSLSFSTVMRDPTPTVLVS